jgi:acyl-CoA synthetase (AMP-forming)/AMP-acid ligase II
MATSLNLANLFEAVVDHCPEREAIVVGSERRLTYAQLEERANRLAHHLLAQGVRPGDFVGLQLLNGTEYIEGMLAAFKIRAVPVNVNYRYVEGELRYLYEDAGLVALVANEQFEARVEAARPAHLRHVLVLERDYEDALAAASPDRDFAERSADDLYCVYTGGTTGMPKGVLWRHEDIFFAALGGGDPMQMGNTVASPEELSERIPDVGMTALPTPPFMHSSAHWLAFSILFGGGKIVVTPQGRFDPELVWQLVSAEGVNTLVVVGDAMAIPMADALEAAPDKYDTSQMIVIGSGGALLAVDQGPAHRAVAQHHDRRRLRLLGDGHDGQQGQHVGPRPVDRPALHRQRPDSGARRRRPAGGAGFGPDRSLGAARPHPPRLPQRPGEDGSHLPGGRRGALGPPG